MTVNIDEELSRRIQAVAAVRGQSPDRYVAYAVAATLNQEEDDNRPNTYDPVNGKGKSLVQFVDEQREKHGFPADWGTQPVYLTDEDWADFEAADAKMYPEVVSTAGPDK